MASQSSPQPIERYYRYCPACGEHNSELGEMPFRCGRCGFSQFFGPVAAVGALLINQRNELLLVRRACNPGKGDWGLPGGFVDREETIETAMRREVMEETKLEVTDTRYLMSYPNQYDYRGIVTPVVDMFFTARAVCPQDLELADDELDHHQWVRPATEHLERMAFYSNRLAIETWLAQQ